MKNCKEVFRVTPEETAGDLMTILEAKRETRLAIWQKHIQDQRSSGLTVRAWCAQNGCSEKSSQQRNASGSERKSQARFSKRTGHG